jgi:outer membrane protein assembly factor BamB
VTVKDRTLLVVAQTREVVAFDATQDKLVWTCKCGAGRYPCLTYGNGLLFVSGDGGEEMAIDPTGEGDVSKTHVKWRHKRAGQGFSTPVVVGDRLYRVTQKDQLTCWKCADGELVAEKNLEGVPTYPSPVVTKDGTLYFASGGKSVLVKAGEKLEVLGKTNVLEETRGEGGRTARRRR